MARPHGRQIVAGAGNNFRPARRHYVARQQLVASVEETLVVVLRRTLPNG